MAKKTRTDRPRPPVKPKGFSGERAALWNVLVKSMGDRLRPEDAPILESFCRAHVQLTRALADLEGEKLVLDLPNGTKQLNPAVKAIDQLRKLVGEGSSRLGLSPNDRVRLKLADDANAEVKAFDDYINDRPPVRPAEFKTVG